MSERPEDVIREALRLARLDFQSHGNPEWSGRIADGDAALDALVAERDEARETADDALDTMLEYERERDALVAERRQAKEATAMIAEVAASLDRSLAAERERAERLAEMLLALADHTEGGTEDG